MRVRSKKRPRRYHHGDLRNALLKAARDLLEERGPSHLGLREIARRVGVSAPSAYHYFPSGEALALGLAEQGAEEMATALASQQDATQSALAPYGEAYVAFALANPALYRLMFGEGFSTLTRNSAAVQRLRERAYAMMMPHLDQRLPIDDLRAAALFIWSIVHGLSLLMIDGQTEQYEAPDVVIRRVLKFAGSGLIAARADGH